MSSRPIVAIDGRMVGPFPHGIARYVTLLARGLETLGSLPYEPVFLSSRETPKGSFAGFRSMELAAGFLRPAEIFEIPSALKKLGADLYHSPSFSALVSCPCPWIATVHDLNHLHFGSLRDKVYYRFILKPFARRARKLLTVSEFSRGELSRWTHVPESAIEVVYNAIDPGFAKAVDADFLDKILKQHGLKRGEYFLCLSNPKPHKNLDLLVRAYAEFRSGAGPKSWPLILGAGPSGAPQGIEGVKILGPVGDSEGRALVEGAGRVVFPSLYEGFGLPPVEALVAGVPVVASRIAPHLEGLIEAGPGEVHFVEASDFRGWVEAFSRPLSRPSPDTRSKTLARFGMRRLAEHMDRIYRGVLGQEL